LEISNVLIRRDARRICKAVAAGRTARRECKKSSANSGFSFADCRVIAVEQRFSAHAALARVLNRATVITPLAGYIYRRFRMGTKDGESNNEA
jgi:hypothetical protein